MRRLTIFLLILILVLSACGSKQVKISKSIEAPLEDDTIETTAPVEDNVIETTASTFDCTKIVDLEYESEEDKIIDKSLDEGYDTVDECKGYSDKGTWVLIEFFNNPSTAKDLTTQTLDHEWTEKKENIGYKVEVSESTDQGNKIYLIDFVEGVYAKAIGKCRVLLEFTGSELDDFDFSHPDKFTAEAYSIGIIDRDVVNLGNQITDDKLNQELYKFCE